jgi:hypothetical protein
MANLTGPMQVFPVDSTDRSTTAKLPLGTVARDAAGNEYTYVRAGAAIAAADAVRFGGSATGFDDIRPTSAAAQYVVGAAAGTAFDSLAYGFILTKGVATVKVVVATAAGSVLVTNGTAGTLALATATELAGSRGATALVTGVAAGSAVYIG